VLARKCDLSCHGSHLPPKHYYTPYTLHDHPIIIHPPSHTTPSSPHIPNIPKKKQWSFQGAEQKDLALLTACAKHKVWDLKHKEVGEGWNKVQGSTWDCMAEDINAVFKQPSTRGCQHRYMEYAHGNPDQHTDLTPKEQTRFTELLSDIKKGTEVSDKMREWKDEKKGVKDKHKETAMKQRNAMMKKMVRDNEDEEDSEEETIDDSSVSLPSSEVLVPSALGCSYVHYKNSHTAHLIIPFFLSCCCKSVSVPWRTNHERWYVSQICIHPILLRCSDTQVWRQGRQMNLLVASIKAITLLAGASFLLIQ